MHSQLRHKDVCHAELEDRLRSTQSPGGFGSVSAQVMPILSRGAEDVTEQPVHLPSHPWRKHKVREGKPEQPESERFRSERIREMEGGLEYTRNRFTYIVKMMDGLVSLVLLYMTKLKVLPQAWWDYGRVQNCSIPWLPKYPTGICVFPSLVRLPGTGSASHNMVI